MLINVVSVLDCIEKVTHTYWVDVTLTLTVVSYAERKIWASKISSSCSRSKPLNGVLESVCTWLGRHKGKSTVISTWNASDQLFPNAIEWELGQDSSVLFIISISHVFTSTF